MCARETFVGFPLRVQSKAANGGPDFCGAKISSTKREPPKGWLSFGASSGIYPKGHKLRLPGGKTAEKKDAERRLSFLVPRRGFTLKGINFDSPEARRQKRKIPKGIFLFWCLVGDSNPGAGGL
nr:MAG TPA: hypothetical protein [Caudoviricetes sp.]